MVTALRLPMRQWAGLLAILATVSIAPATAGDAPLVVGVFPRTNFTETLQLFAPLGSALSEQLGREVKIESAPDFNAFWQDVEARRFDVVHFNQYHYVRARRHHGYEVIAMNKEHGAATIAGALLVRSNSGITAVSQLRGKKIVFGGGRDAMQAYILATQLLREAGLKAGDYTETFARSPMNAVIAAFHGQADAAGAGDLVLSMPAVTRNIDPSQMRYLAVSAPVAHLPWAVKTDMPVADKARLRDALLGLSGNANGRKVLSRLRVNEFVPAKDREYDVHRKIIREVLNESY
jgi:phosphonate transport system substrate-binding protein